MMTQNEKQNIIICSAIRVFAPDTNCILPLQADELLKWDWVHWYGWTEQLYPVQMYNQHHVEIFPIHSGHLDQTTRDRTLVLRVEPAHEEKRHDARMTNTSL